MSGHVERQDGSAVVGRLKVRADYLAVRNGERRKGPFFLLEVLDRKDGGAARVGFTVTKKQGNAVERNRMRRRFREAVRLTAGFAMKPGHDYVIVARRDALDASFSRLTAALKDRIEGRRSRPAAEAGRNGDGKAVAQGKSREERPGDAASNGAKGQATPSRSSRIRDGQ